MTAHDRAAEPGVVRAARIVLHVTAAFGVVAAIARTALEISRLDRRESAVGALADGALLVAIGIVIEVLALRLRTRAVWVPEVDVVWRVPLDGGAPRVVPFDALQASSELTPSVALEPRYHLLRGQQ